MKMTHRIVLSQEQIDVGNDKIATFMGAEKVGDKVMYTFQDPPYITDKETTCPEWYYLPKLKYHRNFHWILKAAKTCLECYGDGRQYIYDALHDIDIERLFLAVSSFIDWYMANPAQMEHYRRTGKMSTLSCSDVPYPWE